MRVSAIPVTAVAGLLASTRGASFVTSTIHHIPELFTNRAVNSGATSRDQTTKRVHHLAHLRMKILVLSFTLIERALHSSIAVLQYITSTNTPWDRWEIRYDGRGTGVYGLWCPLVRIHIWSICIAGRFTPYLMP